MGEGEGCSGVLYLGTRELGTRDKYRKVPEPVEGPEKEIGNRDKG